MLPPFYYQTLYQYRQAGKYLDAVDGSAWIIVEAGCQFGAYRLFLLQQVKLFFATAAKSYGARVK